MSVIRANQPLHPKPSSAVAGEQRPPIRMVCILCTDA